MRGAKKQDNPCENGVRKGDVSRGRNHLDLSLAT